MSNRITKIFGPPGTGKTTRLLMIVEEAMKAGTPPERIAYMAFTKKAADEAVNRAQEKFNMGPERFPFFRTLHSMAFRDLSMRRDDIMSDEHYKELGNALGFQFTSVDDDFLFIPLGTALGDKVSRIEALSRIRNVSLEDQWCEASERDCPWAAVEQWAKGLKQYKEMRGLMDFTDLLENYNTPLDVDLFIIDEGQDLSPLQWRVVRVAASNAKQIYLAGDDDQCIYSWAGADVNKFLSIRAKTEILPTSWRLPKSIWRLATQITDGISVRQPKTWNSRAEEGSVNFLRYESLLDVKQGTWLLLSRNHRFLSRFRTVMENQGYPYMMEGRHSTNDSTTKAIIAWGNWIKGRPLLPAEVKCLVSVMPQLEGFKPKEEVTIQNSPIATNKALLKMNWMDALVIPAQKREYIRACLANKESLTDKPRIAISTIHRVKGGEADHVVLIPDLTIRPWHSLTTDEEQRVLYVAVTRAKHSLTFIQPQTQKHYPV
jgi:superfamily I DNA/RNA helicase